MSSPAEDERSEQSIQDVILGLLDDDPKIESAVKDVVLEALAGVVGQSAKSDFPHDTRAAQLGTSPVCSACANVEPSAVTFPQDGRAAVDSVDVSDGRALQAEVARLIQQRKAGDPLAAVTLVVDSPLTGTMLRRQLVAEGHLGGGTGNIRLLTAADLIGEVADCAGIAAPADVPRVVREAVVSAVLATDPGPFAVSAAHPSTAQRLSDTLDEREWCALDPDDVTRHWDGFVLVDHKGDATLPADSLAHYQAQLDGFADLLHRATGRPVVRQALLHVPGDTATVVGLTRRVTN